jgi:hypothetical protein
MAARNTVQVIFDHAKLGLAMLPALAGCAADQIKPHPAPKITSVQQLANVHISAISVDRWEDYVASLQPQFAITPATALTLALPRTFNSQNSLAETFSAGLQVGLPQSTQANSVVQSLSNGTAANTGGSDNSGAATNSGTTTNNGVTTNNASATNTGSTSTTSTTSMNGSSTTTQTTTTQQGPGVLPASVLPSATLPNAAALTAPSGATQFDPLLTYTAATAIYQEVQILNT